jgi:hypothetical protein
VAAPPAGAPLPPVVLILDVLVDTVNGVGRYGNAQQGTVYWTSSFSADICGIASGLIQSANALHNHYFYLGVTSNSNSTVSTLLQGIGVWLPPPPNSPGWGNRLIPLWPGKYEKLGGPQ